MIFGNAWVLASQYIEPVKGAKNKEDFSLIDELESDDWPGNLCTH